MGYNTAEGRNKADSLGELILRRKGYLRLRLLGQGAFSRVYCVEHRESGRICACKISENKAVLEKEAGVMAQLNHPLFPAYLDYWSEMGLGFLFSGYVAGCSMEEMLERRGHFTAKRTLRAGIALAEGLRYLHERPDSMLFRDVKPANIMICQDGGIKLIDLGCVCTLEDRGSSRAGTPGFAAPEQLSGRAGLTPACDVYGLGRTMEEMLGRDRALEWAERRFGEDCKERKERKGPKGRKQWKEGKGAKSRKQWKERRNRGRLRRILKACTREEASRRMQDMGQVIRALERLDR